jgi:hypothetical protein
MSAKLPRTLSRLTLAGLVASFALVSDPASARPARAKTTTRAPKIERHEIQLGRAHIKKARARRGESAATTPGTVKPNTSAESKFVLSANTPNVPYRGRLIGHYPREWRPAGNSLGPGGEVWLSQNQVGPLSYAEAKLNVEPGFDYEVTLCTWNGSSNDLVRATVGGVTHTFESGNKSCDITFVLKAQDTGWTTIKIDFANEPQDNHDNAFAILGVEVARRTAS